MKKYQGTIYLNNGRYWWKVRLPGDKKCSYVALKPKGSKFATKDKKIAELTAAETWQIHLKEQKPEYWDGKLTTLVQLYNHRNQEYYLSPSKETKNIGYVIFALADYYQDMLADDLTPLHLKHFREHIIENCNLSRSVINRRISMIKRMYRWAVSEVLVSVHTYTALTTVEGLRRGRTKAREGRKVKAVPVSHIMALLPHISRMAGQMMLLQLYTGMRSSEICQMRTVDIEITKGVWFYRPRRHKTEHHGHVKTVLIGPRAQAIIKPYLDNDRPMLYLFLTRYNQPFDKDSYRHEFLHAFTKADKNKVKIPYFTPHQIRHTAGTLIRKRFDLDAARVILGHRKMAMTDEYAELDLQKAKKVAKMIG